MVGVRRDAEFAQLQSQERLRDRLITQIRFKAKLICVSGKAGSGKSSLANAVLENASFAHLALLSAAKGDDGRVRRELLQQLVKDPLFNQDDPLFESYQRNVKESHSPLLIVIDDAQALSEQVLTELVEFYQHYNQLYQHDMSLLLFAEPNSGFNAQLDALSNQVLYFDVAPLSEGEALQLASLLFNRAEYVAEFENQQAIEQHISSAQGNPRLIYQFVDQIVTGDIPMTETSTSNRNKLYIVIAVILCAAVAGLLVQVINDWGGEQTDDSRISLALMEEPTLANGSAAGDDAAQAANTQGGAGVPLPETAELPSQDLPDELTLNNQGAASELRVVVEDDVVNKLLAEQNAPQQSAQTSTEIQDSANLLAEDVAPEAEPSASETVTSEAVPIKVTDVKTLLEAKPSQHYTLQLMALNNREKAQQFVSSRQWQHEVWVYRSSANPNVPYKIIYGDFVSREDAQAARKQLQQQKLDSLIKQFKQVQFELTR
ncbi:AAA family ATPase [Agarivorans gilvus]|uniref:Cell division protein n=1 Tax=Agarivorans gilvus TaxID=680279 RepID=A0ABQ1I7T8_9ALTE|nr:AAA family ATPase [Agarivorans gilvus]GGB19657.1 cell division protein [Agarivorans gilvus]